MAARNDRELCNVCLERFESESRPPVALSCGHSFCRPCLVSQHSSNSSIQCPECRHTHAGEDPRDLPVNYLLLSVVERLTENRLDQSICEEHTQETRKNPCCKDVYSSESDSDEDYKDIKIKEVNKESKNKKNDIMSNCINDPVIKSTTEEDIRSTTDEDKSQLLSNISSEKSGSKALDQRKVFLFLAVMAGAISFGLASCYLIAPAMLESWGFTEKGVRPKSFATQLMSETAKTYGVIPEDSWVSWYQRAGVKGFNTATKVLLFFTGFFIFGSISLVIYSVWYLYTCIKPHYKQYKDIVTKEVQLIEERNNIV